MKILSTTILLLLLVCVGINTVAQDRIQVIADELTVLTIDQPGLDEIVETSVSEVSITEFVRSLGINHKLNISVSNDLEAQVTNNFSNARVADVLVFLCKEFDLDIEVIGGIISVVKYEEVVEPITIVRRLPNVTFSEQNGFLSVDLKQDSLDQVARQITKASFRNIVLAPGLEGKLVSAYIQNRPFEDAMEKLCFANGLEMEVDGNFYMIRPLSKDEETSIASNSRSNRNEPNEPSGDLEVIMNDSLVTVWSQGASVSEIVDEVSRKMLKNYFIYTEPEGNMSLFVENATYEQFLSYLFHGTDFSFTYQDEVYLIGSQEDGLVTTELVQLKNRTIENVFGNSGGGNRNNGNRNSGNAGTTSQNRNNNINVNSSLIPDGLSIQPFPELNSFIVSGSYPDVKTFKDFIFEIDQVVPVVLIEVLIVDVNKNRTLSGGINAGIGPAAETTQGSITGSADDPGLNVDLSTESINELLNTFNGFGVVNLGAVSPNFYMSIQALESDGVLRTRSTPKLSTLNSYTASLKIGRKEYFLETRTNVNPSAANTVISEQQIWQPLDADLSIEITPVVSGAEQVTMDINVIQSNFTERSGANGPFGSVNREFESSIRVKNGEMILLGGLEDKSVNNSGGGLPFLARIPVIRWFFGSRTKTKSNSKLNIFIRPTIMY